MTEVSYAVPSDLPDATLLGMSAQALLKINGEEREEAIATLFKLVDGVLGNPDDAKKRRVKKANPTFHRKVGQHPAALQFLYAAGFQDADDPDDDEDAGKDALLAMRVAYLTRLTDAHHLLAQTAKEAGLSAPSLPFSAGTFNPYQANFQATDSTNRTVAPETWKSESDGVREEIRKREREIKETVEAMEEVPMNPSAFWLSAGRRLEEAIEETAAITEQEERRGDSSLLMSQVASVKAAVLGTNAKFESADKRRLGALSRTRVSSTAVLRVICPDKSILQVTFRAGDRGEHVLAQLAPLFSASVRNSSWYMYQSPPLKRLEPRESLLKAGLSPGGSLYLGFDGAKPPAPYLEDSLVAQLGPAPNDRGVNSTFSGEAMGWGQGKRLGGT